MPCTTSDSLDLIAEAPQVNQWQFSLLLRCHHSYPEMNCGSLMLSICLSNPKPSHLSLDLVAAHCLCHVWNQQQHQLSGLCCFPQNWVWSHHLCTKLEAKFLSLLQTEALQTVSWIHPVHRHQCSTAGFDPATSRYILCQKKAAHMGLIPATEESSSVSCRQGNHGFLLLFFTKLLPSSRIEILAAKDWQWKTTQSTWHTKAVARMWDLELRSNSLHVAGV